MDYRFIKKPAKPIKKYTDIYSPLSLFIFDCNRSVKSTIYKLIEAFKNFKCNFQLLNSLIIFFKTCFFFCYGFYFLSRCGTSCKKVTVALVTGLGTTDVADFYNGFKLAYSSNKIKHDFINFINFNDINNLFNLLTFYYLSLVFVLIFFLIPDNSFYSPPEIDQKTDFTENRLRYTLFRTGFIPTFYFTWANLKNNLSFTSPSLACSVFYLVVRIIVRVIVVPLFFWALMLNFNFKKWAKSIKSINFKKRISSNLKLISLTFLFISPLIITNFLLRDLSKLRKIISFINRVFKSLLYLPVGPTVFGILVYIVGFAILACSFFDLDNRHSLEDIQACVDYPIKERLTFKLANLTKKLKFYFKSILTCAVYVDFFSLNFDWLYLFSITVYKKSFTFNLATNSFLWFNQNNFDIAPVFPTYTEGPCSKSLTYKLISYLGNGISNYYPLRYCKPKTVIANSKLCIIRSYTVVYYFNLNTLITRIIRRVRFILSPITHLLPVTFNNTNISLKIWTRVYIICFTIMSFSYLFLMYLFFESFYTSIFALGFNSFNGTSFYNAPDLKDPALAQSYNLGDYTWPEKLDLSNCLFFEPFPKDLIECSWWFEPFLNWHRYFYGFYIYEAGAQLNYFALGAFLIKLFVLRLYNKGLSRLLYSKYRSTLEIKFNLGLTLLNILAKTSKYFSRNLMLVLKIAYLANYYLTGGVTTPLLLSFYL